MNATTKIPHHVAIIMDGNGRWARQRGLDRTEGHIRGVESLRKVMTCSRDLGIKYLTVYTFSTENWGRPQEEVDALMELLCKCVVSEEKSLVDGGIRVKMIGDRTGLSEAVKESINRIETNTAHCDKATVVLAFNYSSKSEITNSVKRLAHRVASGELDPQEIDETMISNHLYTIEIPDPDLIIRTGGEFRLSNFLLWQGAYAELYFTPTLWPDFDEESLKEAVAAYSMRDRRYGRLNDEQ